MRFQGEECVLNMASYFNRSDVSLNGTLWVRRPADGSTRYRQPWLHFRHTIPATENDSLRHWLQAVAQGTPVDPLNLPGQVQELYQIATTNPDEISIGLRYDRSPEPPWWAWDITSPLHIRLDITRAEFINLITVFDQIEWSFY